MKNLGCLVFSIFCLTVFPCLCSAQETKFFLVPDAAIDDLIQITESDVLRTEKTPLSSSVPLKLCRTLEPQREQAFSEEWPEEAEGIDLIADPLEPLNRVFFIFNDKLYFWLLKPVATGYEKVIPQDIRICVRNFFYNISMPIRAVNCLLQGRIKGFGNELLRFFINSTAGVAGFADPAKHALKLDKQDEDFGQTLGFFGLGPGVYINWPILGPSSLRDSVGMMGDYFLNPLGYAIDSTKSKIAVGSFDFVNETSLTLGDYESLKKAALDPYVALRDAYYQYRKNKIKQ